MYYYYYYYFPIIYSVLAALILPGDPVYAGLG